MAKYFTDLNLDFLPQNDGDLKLDENEDAVKNSIKNILNTLQGERRMLPLFAYNIYYTLFDPIDEITAHKIGRLILKGIQDWDSRVIIENVNITPDYDNEQYKIILTFRIQNMQENTKVDFILKRLK